MVINRKCRGKKNFHVGVWMIRDSGNLSKFYRSFWGLKWQSMKILTLQRTLYLMNWATELLIVDWFEAGANLEVGAEMGCRRHIKKDLHICKLQEKSLMWNDDAEKC